MYHLATLFPFVRRIRIPLSRDQAMLLMMAVNELFLGFDTYLAHSISGTIRPYEWIPIIFGSVSGLLLLLAGLIALKKRSLATVIATLTLMASIGVGLLGAYFHWVRAILPTGPAGQQVNIDLLVWAPPMVAPLTFCLVGVLGISAVWIEQPVDSGVLALLGGKRLRLPFSKTRAYFFWVSLGMLATVLSSVLDHARVYFENPWLWVPTVTGIFGTVVIAALGFIEKPTRADLIAYVATLLVLILVGLVGTLLHVQADLVGENAIVVERFLRGAPFLAPLLFDNMAALGLIILLDPAEMSRS
jgi:hypothetical protein